ncbi:MAG: DUF115 domain-containing protein [bacterium]|nr:DUF115 domain-containing protein [bacterium]
MQPSPWQNNLKALRSRDPDLALHIASAPPSGRYIAGRAGDGSPLLGVVTHGTKPVALNHPQSPRDEAAHWVESLGSGFTSGGHVVLLGFGSGYHPLALFDASDAETAIWIVEPHLDLFQAALHLLDCTALFQSPRVHFAVGIPEKAAVQRIAAGPTAHRLQAQGVQMTVPAYAKQLLPDYIQRFSHELSLTIQLEKLKFRTWEEQAETILKNSLANLPAVLRGAPILRLMNRAVYEPAFVIAPGPSLEWAIPLIRTLAPRVWLIAVDTAHRILMKHGIESDLVVSIDFTELNARHYEGVEDHNACLAAFPAIDPSIPLRYEGRAFYYDHAASIHGGGANQFWDILTSLPSLGKLISYGSTAHAACHLARLMGCNPIVLIGNDLGFPGRRFYAAGAMQNDLDQPERDTEPLLDVPANDGSIIQTNGLYKLYLDGFTELIKDIAGVTVNVSPDGAAIESCPFRPLEDIADDLPQTPLNKEWLQAAARPGLSSYTESVSAQITQMAARYESIRTEIRRLEKRVERINPSDPAFPSEMKRLLMNAQRALHHDFALVNLALSLHPRSYLMLTAKQDDARLSPSATLDERRRAQERHLQFMRDLADSLRIHSRLFEKTASDLKPYLDQM